MYKECRTIGELKQALEGYEDSSPLLSTAHDCGGYDAIRVNVIVVEECEDKTMGVFVGGKDDEHV
jgi:hypothetical protein